MLRNIAPILNDDLGSYWRKCDGKFVTGWHEKSKKYIEKNITNDLKLTFINGNWKVVKK